MVTAARFVIKPADNFIWNHTDLVGFLAAHQGSHIELNSNEEGCCFRSIGLYTLLDKFEFAQVDLYTSNSAESHDQYRIHIQRSLKFCHVQQRIESQHHVWNQKKVFGTLYGRPLWHRMGIAAHLLTSYAEQSSVGFVANPNEMDSRQLFEIQRLWQYDPDSADRFMQIKHLLPLVLPVVDQYQPGQTLTDGYVSQTKTAYPDFLIDIAAETFTSGQCFFPTEKTIRPMLLKKPFIVFGPTDHLLNLRRLGFRTFADFWDETYDGFDNHARYVKILELIQSLAKRSVKELEAMYWDMQYTLDHNYDLLFSAEFQHLAKSNYKVCM